MKKLLVGGDSFGEFPRYEYLYMEANDEFRYRTQGSDPSINYTYSTDYPHWCELLATRMGTTAESYALPGRDISSTTFSVTKQLLTKEYSHMVFFVTSFLRESIQLPEGALIDKLEKLNELSDTSLADYFNCRQLHSDDSYLIDMNNTDGHHFEQTYKHLTTHFGVVHDRLSNLIALYSLAKSLGVKPMFVIQWPNKGFIELLEDVIGDPCYFKTGLPDECNSDNFKYYNAIRSHLYEKDHENILNEFLQQNPTFVDKY